MTFTSFYYIRHKTSHQLQFCYHYVHRRPAADRALERAAWSIYFEEEPRVVMRGLQGLELPGRAGTCLRVAVGCLERAGRCRRVERGMRREAARWVRRAREEMGR